MNYASIDSWNSAFQDLFSGWPQWKVLENPSVAEVGTASTHGKHPVAQRAAAGVQYLKGLGPIESCDVESVSTCWWLSQALKKFSLGCIASEEDTYAGFEARNLAARAHVIPPRHYRRVRELLARALPLIDDDGIDGRFGPGAVAERWNTLQKWSYLPDFSYDARSMCLASSGARDSSPVARLCCVPKDYDKLRLITVEPAENSFGQQWVRSVLLASVHAGSLRGTVMDLGHQYKSEDARLRLRSDPVGQRLVLVTPERLQRLRCLRASATAKAATLDLTDASDSISFEQVCGVFPSWVVAYLSRFRTPSFSRKGKSEQELFLYAGMGNATTFVVETLFFWACVTSVCEWLGDFTPVTVFGDDIMCGNAAANHPLFMPELKKFGLVINAAKSGWSQTPGFREACGLVAHSGYELHALKRIRGFSSACLSDLIDLCDLSNRLCGSVGESSSEDDSTHLPCGLGTLPAHEVLGYVLSEDLISRGVPNLRSPLQRTGVWLCCPYFPVSESDKDGRFPCSYRWNHVPRNNRRPAEQLEEYNVLVRAPKTRRYYRRHLSTSEALGVITRSLGQLTTLNRRGREATTVIRIALRDVEVSPAWVGAW